MAEFRKCLFQKIQLRTFARNFSLDRFFYFLLQSRNELLVPEMQNKSGVTVFFSDIKHVEDYPDFDKLTHVIQHGLQGVADKSIEGQSAEANDLSLILNKCFCCVNNSKFHQRFHKT